MVQLQIPRERARKGDLMETSVFKSDAVRSLLSNVNSTLPEEGRFNVDAALAGLLAQGAGVELVAKGMSFEEIREATGIPMSIARAIAVIWREESKKPEPAAAPAAQQMSIGGASGTVAEFAMAFGNVSALNDVALLLNYDPTGRDDIVQELSNRSKCKAFIVFADKTMRRVDVDRSLGNLTQLKMGVELGGTTMIDGRLVNLYRAGEVPDLALNICPVHEAHLVGTDEMCPKCQRSWKGISDEARELAYMQTQEVWGEQPGSSDPRLVQLFSALSNPKDPYLSSAALAREDRRATGQPIVLVKAVKQSR